MNKQIKVNEEAAMNNNLGASTLQMNQDIIKQHEKSKEQQTNSQKKSNDKLH